MSDPALALSKPSTPENAGYGTVQSPDAATQGEMINSLGAALAGVNIGGSNGGTEGGGGNAHNKGGLFAGSNDNSSPFSTMTSGQSQTEHELGWASTFSDASKSAFSGSNAAPAPPDMGHETQIKESLDLFLSQSPSQTLGEDVFKLSHADLPNLALADDKRQNSGESSPFSFNGGSIQQGKSLMTGTAGSSRSNSPYATTNGTSQGGIPAFRYSSNSGGNSASGAVDMLAHRQASYGGEESQKNMSHGYSSHPSIPTLDQGVPNRNLFGSVGAGSPFEKDRNFAPQPVNQQPAAPQNLNTNAQQQSQQPQPQVLYMAVPSPDGRGQVLQPVQMMQVQGKGLTYVVPQGMNQGPMNGNGNMLPPMNGHENGNGMMGNEQRNPMDDYRSKNYSMDGGMKDDDYGDMGKGGNYGIGQDPTSSLYATTQTRPPLDALLGQVRRLSRDQVGCRLVQQALDEEGPMAATMILNEGLPFWSEAMVDPFGNYLFQKILEKITAKERIMLIKTVSSRLVNASLNLHGTRSVQKIVELCADDENSGFNNSNAEVNGESSADILTLSLFPAAARLCIDSHGNHVIQRILLKLGPKHTKFVFDAVAASVGDVARHRHGCCVIQRCLDSPVSESRSHLVNRIVDKSLELMQDAYGNYVVQYVLDVCSDEDVHAVCESVVGKVNLLAIQKFSSNVMEKCLERCTDSTKEKYMAELADTERVRELMMDPFGNYVVQRALSVATHAQAIRLVEAMRPHLVSTQPGFPNGPRSGGVRNTAGGRRIMAKICRRFPNFTLSAGGSQEELFSQSKPHHRQGSGSGYGGHHGHGGHGFGGHHGSSPYGAPVHGHGSHRRQKPHHYGGDPGVIAGTHLVMNQQQAFYDAGNVNVGYSDHNSYDPFGGQNFSQQNFDQSYGGYNHNGFPNM